MTKQTSKRAEEKKSLSHIFEDETSLKAYEDLYGEYDNNYIGAFATDSYIAWLEAKLDRLQAIEEKVEIAFSQFITECSKADDKEAIDCGRHLRGQVLQIISGMKGE